MTPKSCVACGGEIEFNAGFMTAVGNQPYRAHADCPTCGTPHYLTASGIVAIDEPERRERADADRQ